MKEFLRVVKYTLITASAAQPQVRVIVENTTYPVEGGAPWDGV